MNLSGLVPIQRQSRGSLSKTSHNYIFYYQVILIIKILNVKYGNSRGVSGSISPYEIRFWTGHEDIWFK